MAVNDNLKAATSIDPAVWRVAAVAFVGPFMTQMDSTVVNVSLSTIRGELHTSIAAAQWVLSGYLLALALMLPVNGWLVDRVGARRLYLGCFSAFTLASLLCGAARTIDALVLARIFQGVAGGLLAPMAQMMIARVAGKNMARVLGYAAVPILIAPILGPVIAGAILKYAAWPWLFYLNLPVGILGVTLAFFLLPRDEASSTRRPFDIAGFLMISPGLACLLYGFPRATRSDGVATLLAGALLMAGFVVHARRLKFRALIDLELFRIRVFSAAAATQFFANAAFYATQFLVPLYLITGCAQSPSQAGWLVAAVGAGMMCSFPFVGNLTDRFGCRAVSAGGAVAALCGMLPFLWMSHSAFSAGAAGTCLFVTGIGQGTINIPSDLRGVRVRPERTDSRRKQRHQHRPTAGRPVGDNADGRRHVACRRRGFGSGRPSVLAGVRIARRALRSRLRRRKPASNSHPLDRHLSTRVGDRFKEIRP